MPIIGLTGSIAAGKSTVSALLREFGATVIDADVIAREVVEPGTEGSRRIREAFGSGVFDETGSLNRRALGEIVFADEAKRKALNAIVHPLVIAQCGRRAREAVQNDPHAVAVIDAALLIEAGMQASVDAVVLVTAEDDIRKRRIIERDGLCAEHAAARMAAQMPQSEKLRYAHYVIDNSHSVEKTREQVQELYRRLRVSGADDKETT